MLPFTLHFALFRLSVIINKCLHNAISFSIDGLMPPGSLPLYFLVLHIILWFVWQRNDFCPCLSLKVSIYIYAVASFLSPVWLLVFCLIILSNDDSSGKLAIFPKGPIIANDKSAFLYCRLRKIYLWIGWYDQYRT